MAAGLVENEVLGGATGHGLADRGLGHLQGGDGIDPKRLAIDDTKDVKCCDHARDLPMLLKGTRKEANIAVFSGQQWF